MKTISIEGFIYFDPEQAPCSRRGLGQYRFFGNLTGGEFGTYIPVVPYTLTFEMPDDFDHRPEQVKQLEAQKKEITAKFQAAVTEINSRISKLQALTFEQPASHLAEENFSTGCLVEANFCG